MVVQCLGTCRPRISIGDLLPAPLFRAPGSRCQSGAPVVLGLRSSVSRRGQACMVALAGVCVVRGTVSYGARRGIPAACRPFGWSGACSDSTACDTEPWIFRRSACSCTGCLRTAAAKGCMTGSLDRRRQFSSFLGRKGVIDRENNRLGKAVTGRNRLRLITGILKQDL